MTEIDISRPNEPLSSGKDIDINEMDVVDSFMGAILQDWLFVREEQFLGDVFSRGFFSFSGRRASPKANKVLLSPPPPPPPLKMNQFCNHLPFDLALPVTL